MKLRCLLLAKDGTVAEYARIHAAHFRILVGRDHQQRRFKAETVLRIDEHDEDPVVLYREVEA